MKKHIKNKLVIAMLIFTSVISGCKKDEETPTTPVISEQKVTLHVHSMVGTSVATYGVEYQDSTGRKFNITDFRYYLSNIILIKSDGSELPINGKILLVNPATQNYELSNVPIGNYQGFKFTLGLDSATNHSDPTVYTSENPLSIQTPSIHWSWNSGYIFMKVEGKVDTTVAHTGTPDYDYFYHVGMDMLKRDIDFSNSPFTVSNTGEYQIVVEFDLLKVLRNVDMRMENSTHTMDNMPLATKIADNWQNAFTVL